MEAITMSGHVVNSVVGLCGPLQGYVIWITLRYWPTLATYGKTLPFRLVGVNSLLVDMASSLVPAIQQNNWTRAQPHIKTWHILKQKLHSRKQTSVSDTCWERLDMNDLSTQRKVEVWSCD